MQEVAFAEQKSLRFLGLAPEPAAPASVRDGALLATAVSPMPPPGAPVVTLSEPPKPERRFYKWKNTYPDQWRANATVTESLAVDKGLGLFRWSTVADPIGASKEKRRASQLNKSTTLASLLLQRERGGCWRSADIAYVSFTTKRGDPNHEYINGLHYVHFAIRIAYRYTVSRAKLLRRALMVFVNPLSFVFVVCVATAAEVWLVFPKVDGDYDMARPADEEAIKAATGLAIATFIGAMVAAYWLGFGSLPSCCANCITWEEDVVQIDRESRASRMSMRGPPPSTLQVFTGRLPKNIARRWPEQKWINRFLFLCIFGWSAAVFVVCPLALQRGRAQLCAPSDTAAGRRLSGCYSKDNPILTCGVGPCSCSVYDNLFCRPPPPLPDVLCVTTWKPLCVPPGSGLIASNTRIMLSVVAIGFSITTGLVGLGWLMNGYAMYCAWFKAKLQVGILAQNDQAHEGDEEPEEIDTRPRYHLFKVMFQDRKEKPLLFTVDGKKDPLEILVVLAGGSPSILLNEEE